MTVCSVESQRLERGCAPKLEHYSLNRHTRLRWLLLAGVCTLAIAPFFWFGNPSGHDFEVHVFSWMNAARQWKEGVFYPRWADLSYWGYGEPTFIFYPPASWTVGGFLGLFLPWRMVPGAFCWLALMLAGIAMYEVAKWWLSNIDAAFAAVFYVVNPYFLVVIYWRSAFAELLAAALFPLLLLFVTRLEKPHFRPTLWLSLIFAVAWITNVPAAIMIHYTAAGLALVLALRGKSARPLVKLAVAVMLAAGLASFYLVPAIYEQRWVQIAQVLSPGVRPQDNFLFTATTDLDHNHFNRLVSWVGIGEICALAFAIFLARSDRARRSLWQLFSIWGAAACFFLFSSSWIFWEYLPKFRYVQLPFRWLLCVNVALALLLTMATAASRLRDWISRSVAIAILIAVVFFVGKHTQPPWWDTVADLEEMRQSVLDGSGYEGVYEYVPTAADPDAVNKVLPRLSDETGTAVAATMIEWHPTMKHFRVVTSEPTDLTVRLFNYPAWKAVVNGRPLDIKTSDAGLVVLPLPAGENDVQILFTRTLDRTLGTVISCLSASIFFGIWIWTGRKRRPVLETMAR
jgi:hypothetical protein